MKRILLLTIFIHFCIAGLYGQDYIRGTVSDFDTGEELIGVNVIIKDSQIGTVTNIDGSFNFKIPEDFTTRPIILIVSYVGFKTQEVTVKNLLNNEIRLGENGNPCDMMLLLAVIITHYNLPKNISGLKTILENRSHNNYQSTNMLAPINEMPGIHVSNDGFNSSNIIIRGIQNQKINIGSIPIYTGLEENILENLEPLLFNQVSVQKKPLVNNGAALGGSIYFAPKFSHPFFSSYTSLGDKGFLKTSNTFFLENENEDCVESRLSVNHSYTNTNGFRENDAFQKHSFTLLGNRKSGQIGIDRKEHTHLIVHYSNVKKALSGPLSFNQLATVPTSIVDPTWQTDFPFNNQETGIVGLSQSFRLSSNYNLENTNTTSIFGTLNRRDRLIMDWINFQTYTWGGKSNFNFRFKRAFYLNTGIEFYKEENLWTLYDQQDAAQTTKLNENKDQKTYFDWYINGKYAIKKLNYLEINGGLNLNKSIVKREDLFEEDQENNNQTLSVKPILSPSLGLRYKIHNKTAFEPLIFANINHGFTRTATGSRLLINESTKEIVAPIYGWNYEVGFNTDWKDFRANLTFYNSQIKNLYFPFYFNSEHPVNAVHQGLEFSFGYEGGDLEFYTAYNYNHHRFKDQTMAENAKIPGLTPHHFNLGILYHTNYFWLFEKATFRLNYELVGPTDYDFIRTERTKPYHLLQAKIVVDWEVSRDIDIQFHLGANNILNQKYLSKYEINTEWQLINDQTNYYPGMPFHFYGGVKFSLKEIPSSTKY